MNAPHPDATLQPGCEMLILRKADPEEKDVPAVFAVWDRRVGWFQYDYAERLVGDPTLAQGTLDGRPCRVEQDPSEGGCFRVRVR